MQLIVDTFEGIFDMQQIFYSIRSAAEEEFTSECMMLVQVAESVCFACAWKQSKRFGDPLSFTVKQGLPNLFKLFYNVDKSWFWNITCIWQSEDQNEYIQLLDSGKCGDCLLRS